MPSPQQVLIFLVSKLALSFDSPILGVALGYASVRTLLKLSSYSSALSKVRIAPSVKISDLRSSLAFDQSDQSTAKLAIIRGTVEAKSALDDSKWNIFKKSDLLVSRGTIDRAVMFGELKRYVFVSCHCSLYVVFLDETELEIEFLWSVYLTNGWAFSDGGIFELIGVHFGELWQIQDQAPYERCSNYLFSLFSVNFVAYIIHLTTYQKKEKKEHEW